MTEYAIKSIVNCPKCQLPHDTRLFWSDEDGHEVTCFRCDTVYTVYPVYKIVAYNIVEGRGREC